MLACRSHVSPVFGSKVVRRCARVKQRVEERQDGTKEEMRVQEGPEVYCLISHICHTLHTTQLVPLVPCVVSLVPTLVVPRSVDMCDTCKARSTRPENPSTHLLLPSLMRFLRFLLFAFRSQFPFPLSCLPELHELLLLPELLPELFQFFPLFFLPYFFCGGVLLMSARIRCMLRRRSGGCLFGVCRKGVGGEVQIRLWGRVRVREPRLGRLPRLPR